MPRDIKPDGQKITVRVSDTLDRLYAVKKKANKSPFHEFKGKTIKWVACFGFTLKPGVGQGNRKLDSDGFINGDLEEAYTINLTKDGDELVYYDGEKISTLTFSPANAKAGEMVRATLKAGDPPVGWT
jgi:hypothetical protein